MVKLTEHLALSKAKCSSLSSVRNLNLWGSELDDISIISQMPNVEVLSLSINNISSLASLSQCNSLRELYLRKNAVADLAEIRHLRGLSSLTVLWLCDNPCALHPNYRQFVLQTLPNLTKLDNLDVTADEIETAEDLNLSIDLMSSEGPSGANPSANRREKDEEAPPPPAVSEPVGRPGVKQEVKQDRKGRPPVAAAAAAAAPSAAPSSSKRAPSPARSSSSTSSNVLYAILALLNELDDEGLAIAKAEINSRLKK